MFGRGAVGSILRSRKEADLIQKLRGRSSFSHSFPEESFKFLSPTVTTHCFRVFRSHSFPKGHHLPRTRDFSSIVSARAEHKEGFKLLVKGAHAQKVVGIWLFGSATWVFSMVLLWGLTRLTRSGLSMTDWKFTGTLPPLSDDEWLQEFEKYQQSPEYKR